ncbi:tripartite tricarboxylate transporter permease [Caldimonas thermodepolymerans]|jgi:putative tricarboxylic transport membrane protein|uniref:Tricarboxylic transport membrane protein n=1 Tax=Caldimonas thermodepolymerans TaxID=215580 RepID=A0A2S5T6M7_9BURK|nr:tripartite tricarboxylate transporter permease [Caldimonas thermodepolymerans]PPE70655.1 tripartite tricarboxylate transporter TctA [Caldimonas thermodepolymerans]QPC33257.1 tripartite tricarboxylate transporter permease [Caldimonas thermodepolymerans]RDH97582.1 putative tricarboxylic transport membrane protein [Caldimonas thermodepolymerans]TCP09995.1 putative tricarboxylic transport membrane protein [Caldimonas thermodepolymerans]UZG42706.1 tripartite tricarboxylate transporter permease [
METFDALMGGFAAALQPQILIYGFIGCLLGTLVGVLPGIGPALTIALLLPLTYKVPAAAMFVMFAGVYYGAMYGGSTTSILINTPGESATVVTALEGYKMARRGRAGPALATAAIGSFVAGTIGTLALTFFAPWIVEAALRFGPAEYFSLMVLSLVAVTAVLGSSVLRGLISLCMGLLFGLVGVDLQSGQPRFTFGTAELLDGIEFTAAAVGLFAVGEALYLAWQGRQGQSEVLKVSGRLWLGKEDWRRSWKPWLRGALFGFPIGAMPAGGAELPTLLSYYTEKKLSRHPEEFGQGAIEGVAGPEAANNASAAGVLMPLLTLGIPTSATAAVILSAFEGYGLQPGPMLFTSESGLVWTLIASLYIGNVILLLLNLPLVGLWVKLLSIPAPLLYAGIVLISTVGVYGASNSVFDVGLLYAFGALGYAMRRFDFPVAPLVVGLILGPMMEQSMRQALTISQGQWSTFVTRPLSGSLLLIAALLLALPPLFAWRRQRAAARQAVQDQPA